MSIALPKSPLKHERSMTIEYSTIPPESSAPRFAKWGIGLMQLISLIMGVFAAGLVAVGHHLFDLHLEGRHVNGFWNQAMSRRAENALATVFQILFAFSGGLSLCQVVSLCQVSML